MPLGAPCWAGLDLSASRDLTDLVLVFPIDDKFHVVPHFFLPSQGARERGKIDGGPYDTWAKQGFMTLIDGPVIDPSVIAMAVAEISQDYDLQLLAYDRWRINDFQRELDKLGAQIQMVSFGQGFKDMAPAVDKVERLVAERKLCHGANPVLNFCVANALITQDPAGNRKLDKKRSFSRIDGLVALAMALGCMSTEGEVVMTSSWDDPEFKLAV